VDIATLLGIISAFGLVGVAIVTQGNISVFLNLPSALIVLGGTFGATLVNYPLRDIIRTLKVVRNAFFYKEASLLDLIPEMVRFSRVARKDGLLALERVAESIPDQFLFECMRMVIDGIPADSIRQIMRNEIDFQTARHRVGISIFQAMGAYAPAFGMIGTLIGLILMLRNLESAAAIASAMAVALVTTFYGAMLANIVFLPIAGKLKERSTAEILRKEMILSGVLAIQTGDVPGIVEQRLISFLPSEYRRIYFAEGAK
jgi:chemotaxis protein MotA